MSVGGEAKPLSFDHKPTNQGENSRIVAAGGFVEFGRVNGNLALSRALGDFDFKQNANLDAEQQVVTADPDITVHEATREDEFLVIACDGIWDVLTSQQVIDYVRLSISQDKPLTAICEELMDRCLAPDSDWGGVGCDNMTIMVVALLGDRTQDEWYAWVKQRVEAGEPYATPKELVEPFGQGGNGPRGALMGGSSASSAAGGADSAPSGILGGAVNVSQVPSALSLAFGGAGGHGGAGGSGTGDDDSEDETELDLPTIQAALRARMAELEREEAMDDAEEGGNSTSASAGAADADGDNAMIEDVSDKDSAAAAAPAPSTASADSAAAASEQQQDKASQATAEGDAAPQTLRTSLSPPQTL